MQWRYSLKTKNILFFTFIILIFLFSIMLSFRIMKTKELPNKAEREITLNTHQIIQELFLEEQNNEQLVHAMATIAGSMHSKVLIQKLLNANKNHEILSGSIYLKKKKVYHFVRKNKHFEELHNYAEKSDFIDLGTKLKEGETFWSKMHFDTLTQNKVISLIAPIYRNHLYIGVANLNIKFSLCENNMFSSLINSNEKYFILIDRAGNLLMGSKSITHTANNQSLDALNTPLIKKLLRTNYMPTTKKKRGYTTKIIRKITLIEKDPIFQEASVIASYYFPNTGWRMLISIPNHIIFKQINNMYQHILFIIIIFSLFSALVGYLLIKKSIVNPLLCISQQIHEGATEPYAMIHTKEKGEIELVVHKLNARNKALHLAHEREVANEKLLLQQSKMAAIGEMLDAVAHQWKQPLNALSLYTLLIDLDYKEGKLDESYMQKFQEGVELQIEHMENTLNTFREFFRPATQIEFFNLTEVINNVLLLIKDELTKNLIEVTVEEKETLEVYGSKNEIRHLVLNLINNAKDAFIQNKIEKPLIKISLFKKNSLPILEVQDNAGGIPDSIINEIFKAHVSTKKEMQGTGIGLYMSTQIAQKHCAKLHAVNQHEGASFRLIFSQKNADLSSHMKKKDV